MTTRKTWGRSGTHCAGSVADGEAGFHAGGMRGADGVLRAGHAMRGHGGRWCGGDGRLVLAAVPIRLHDRAGLVRVVVIYQGRGLLGGNVP